MKKLNIVLSFLAMAGFLLGGCGTADYRVPSPDNIYAGLDGGSTGDSAAADSTGDSTA